MLEITLTHSGKTLDQYLTEFENRPIVENLTRVARNIIEENYAEGKNFDGTAATPLKPSTIKQKKSNRVFYNTGLLVYQGVLKRMITKLHGQVYISPLRSKIVSILAAGKPPLAGARNAFGIGQKMLDEFRKVIKLGK